MRHTQNENMKKFLRNFLIMITILLFTGCGRKVTEEEARQALHNHLIERYGEEFEIGYMGLRSLDAEVWFQGEIYPAKYKGTPRENDKYYHRTGTVDIKKGIFGEKISFVGDVYSKVLLNESANEFYLPKLKELFGENVLPIFDIKVSKMAVKPDFYTTYKTRQSEGKKVIISGGIYIFGRVENDEDREKYREEIYKFLSFMKETGTFEYVDLDIEVIDERILSDEFQNSEKLKSQLIENRISWENNEITSKESDEKRKILLNTIKSVNKNEMKSNINNLNKGNMNESAFKETFYTVILYTKIYSPKYVKSNSLGEEKIKNYGKISDIEFDMGGYY